MFEHKTEQQAREEILNIVKGYCKTYHNHLKRETGFLTHPVYMTVQRW